MRNMLDFISDFIIIYFFFIVFVGVVRWLLLHLTTFEYIWLVIVALVMTAWVRKRKRDKRNG